MATWLYCLILALTACHVQLVHPQTYQKCCKRIKKDKSWKKNAPDKLKRWRGMRKNCKKIKGPDICNADPYCIFDCGCDLDKYKNDVIKKIEYKGTVDKLKKEQQQKKRPLLERMKKKMKERKEKRKENKEKRKKKREENKQKRKEKRKKKKETQKTGNVSPKNEVPKKLVDMKDEDYPKNVDLMAIEPGGAVYQVSFDAAKFKLFTEKSKVSEKASPPQSPKRRLIEKVKDNELDQKPFNAVGALIHTSTTTTRYGTGTIIQTYTTEPPRSRDYTWVITAGHVLYDREQILDATGKVIQIVHNGVYALSGWEFYKGLHDSATSSPSDKAEIFRIAECIYVTEFVRGADKVNGELDFGLIKFRGKPKQADELKIAYDNDMKNWQKKEFMTATYRYPMHTGGTHEMQKMDYTVDTVDVYDEYLYQNKEVFCGGMSGSAVIKNDGNKDTIYGIIARRAGRTDCVDKGGYMSRITKSKYIIITSLVPGFKETATGLGDKDTKGVADAHLDDYEEYDDYDAFEGINEEKQYYTWGVYIMIMMICASICCLCAFGFGAIFSGTMVYVVTKMKVSNN